MSESQLNKNFTERDLSRARNIISGNTSDRTRIQVGFEKSEIKHEEGDVWEVKGKTWTIKDGIKQTVTKFDNLKQLVVLPLKCPSCKGAMKVNTYNKKMWAVHKKCFNCVTEEETQLRIEGKFEDYEKSMLNQNKNDFADEYEKILDDFINNPQNVEFFSEAGHAEGWSMGKLDPKMIKKLKENVKTLKETEL
tara:strand:+ start:599 stop:1177 length:579 start_codon:yes stop_codon:yes gene_type:complete